MWRRSSTVAAMSLGTANLDGLGNFGEENIVTTSAFAGAAIGAADLDGDGDVDLYSASYDEYDSDVSWYENTDALGTFTDQKIITADLIGPASVEAVDLDNDDDLDLVVASTLDGQVTWFENDSNGGFGNPKSIDDQLTGAHKVVAADIDGDGLDDIAVGASDYYSPTSLFVWYRNEGGGGFGAPTLISSEMSDVISLDSVDLDGDGDQDLITASRYDETINWFDNTDANGNFSGPIEIPAFVEIPTSVTAADIDQDGKADIAFTGFFNDEVGWMRQGTNQFEEPAIISRFGIRGADAVDSADLDGDGDLDLAVVGAIEGTVVWLENQDGLGEYGDPIVIDQLSGAVHIRTVDLSGDSVPDLLVTSAAESSVVWYENDGAGGFSSRQTVGNDLIGVISAEEGDVDGDGDLDVLVAAPGQYEQSPLIAWFENSNGKGAFGDAQVIASNLERPSDATAADIDGDGDLDFAVVSWSEDIVAWFENTNSKGDFGAAQVVANNVDLPIAIDAGDIDQDGDVDLLVAGFIDNSLRWFSNDSKGAFTEAIIESPGVTGPTEVAFGRHRQRRRPRRIRCRDGRQRPCLV